MTDEWIPKTRDDWVGIFSDGTKKAAADLRSEREEAEAKAKESDTSADKDKTKETGGDNSTRKGKSFAERVLGI